MKTIKSTPTKNGKIRLTVELEQDEDLLAIRPDAYYRLGYPVSDVVHSDVLQGAEQVTWCSVEQKWVE